MLWNDFSLFLRRSNTLKIRLTLFYTALIFFLLLCFSLFLYSMTIHTLHQAGEDFIHDEIIAVEYLLNNPNNIAGLKQEVTDVPSALKNATFTYYTRIWNDHNAITAATAEISKFIGAAHRLDFARSIAPMQKPIFYALHYAGKNYLMAEKIVSVNRKRFLVQVALDTSFQDSLTQEYRRWLLVALAIGSVLSIFFGYLIMARSLRKLQELAETTESITVNSLHQRIAPELWPQELQKLGVAFNGMLDRIEESFQRLTQLAADLAHELRAPINNLLGETELALTNELSVGECRQILQSNLEEAERLSHIIENLIFLAQTENPQLHIPKVWLNVETELENICDYFQAFADEKNIRLRYSGRGKVFASEIMLRRLLHNILSNALKYAPENSQVVFSVTQKPNCIEITLQDNGPGIPAGHLPKLFNRFYRVNDQTALPGSGLGLAIVKSIVNLHQGTISITSELGIGTTVTLVFPNAPWSADGLSANPAQRN